MTDVSNVLDMIKENEVAYVDFRFVDTRGQWHHVALASNLIDEDLLTEGVMFDGSSIAGWKAINESDMVLMPDTDSAVMDPFTAQPQLILFCDVLEPSTGEGYCRCPRSVARKAEAYLTSTGIGNRAMFGPEPEFFVFDQVRWNNGAAESFFHLDSEELPENTGRDYASEEMGNNLGHRPTKKGGYFPVSPIDSMTDLRAEICTVMTEMGFSVERHHHEVAAAQNEINWRGDTLLRTADDVIKFKFITKNVANAYGKTATFMPKPLFDDNGSGMHIHQSVWNDDNPLFAGSEYADLSESALYYIGGIMKHARALNAFANAGTNSYKRLVPGFEAPVLLAYSARNRSAACRIPYTSSPKGKRVEVRFPDALANPYLVFAAMLMAGLDGIQSKIHPGESLDKNLYDLPAEELENVPTVCHSLRDALDALDADREFLKKGNVFTDDLIDGYIELKMEEVVRFEQAPHPAEFDMYYSS
jgi:glutamine synthetase